jgi:exonuclease VII small subunit
MPKSSVQKEKPIEELSYEEALAELEDSIKLFERGQALAARCGALLEAAELKVKKVAGDDLIPFEEESE